MAALRALIHELLAKGATERNYVWYGARSRRDAPYVDEMRDFASMVPNFHWHGMLSGKHVIPLPLPQPSSRGKYFPRYSSLENKQDSGQGRTIIDARAAAFRRWAMGREMICY